MRSSNSISAMVCSPSIPSQYLLPQKRGQKGGFSLPARILQRTNAFPTTGVGCHQAEVIEHNLGGESRVALITIAVFRQPSVALPQRFNCKVWKFDPSGYD
jgi:hypothetical protein